MNIILIFVALLIFYVVQRRLRMQRIIKMIERFDGPKAIPIFGNALLFTGSTTAIYKTVLKLNREYKGRPYRCWLFHKPYVALQHPEDIRMISKVIEKDDSYRFLSDFLGDGLITAKGEIWKRNRIVIDPAFNTNKQSDYFLDIFNKHNQKLVELLDHEADTGKMCSLRPAIFQTAINSIYETTMGFTQKTDSSNDRKLFRSTELIIKRCFTPWLHPEIIFKVYLYFKGFSSLFEEVRNFHLEAIHKKKRMFNAQKNSNATDSEKKKPIIDVLLEHNFSDYSLTNEVMTLIYAGSETTVTTQGFTLLMLAKHQDVQEKVYQEIYEIFGDSDRWPEAADLAKLKYLEQCIKETLRQISPIPMIVRIATEDVPIRNDLIIPRGAGIFISIHQVHHDPELYPEPEVWNPENFDSAKVAKRPLNAFIPFGFGPRLCIGNKYAMMSMKAMLSSIIRKYKLSTDQPDVTVKVTFIKNPVQGYNVKLDRRK